MPDIIPNNQDEVVYEYPAKKKFKIPEEPEPEYIGPSDGRTKRMYHLIAPFRCSNCNGNMLFFLTNKKTYVDYRKIITQGHSSKEAYEMLAKFHVVRLKCLCCNKEWYIDWTHSWPLPLLDETKLQKFGIGN